MPAQTHEPEPLRLRLVGSALPAQLSAVRASIAAWAASMGLVRDTVDDMVLATNEALANVADHAYPGGDGEAFLDAEQRTGEIVVMVRDQGEWRGPPAEYGRRGRGLVIIRGLAEHVDVRRDPAGTTVEMRWPLPTE